jgi:hypothetical protein
MQVTIHAVLMILAIVCFVLRALGVYPPPPRNDSFMAAGLAFWALAVLLG